MKKILYVATVVKTHIMEFHIPYLKMLKEMGWETAVAAKNDYENAEDCCIPYCDAYFDVPFERSPLNFANIRAFRSLKRIVDEGNYDIVHCHTPVGGLLARIACIKARKSGTKVIYTAHGFHFYKGAPLKNWLLYYPVEKFCAHFTDVLITINHEDYELAKKKMKAKRVEYVPGVGIDIEKFANCTVDRAAKRKELGIPEDATLLLSVGELNKNKNHEVVIRAIKDLDVYYVIAGSGELQTYLQMLIDDLDLSDRVKLLGYRDDVAQLYKAADMFVFPSIREGLPVALMEAMASGLPIVCSRTRGNSELAARVGTSAFEPKSVEDCRNKLEFILTKKNSIKTSGLDNAYSDESIISKLKGIYKVEQITNGGER